MKKTDKKLHLQLTSTLRKHRPEGLREFKKLLNTATPVLTRFLSSSKGRPQIKFLAGGELVVGIHIVGNKRVHGLNRIYRGKDKVTDVLSFPVHDNFPLGAVNTPYDLGDIFIAHGVATQQAKSLDVSSGQEIFHLFLHGFLHLCGYDHDLSTKEEKIMMELEEKLSQNIYTLNYGKKGSYER